ncbi:hypothetical protein F441_13570 [Phytophthora nicotianae CJ01A1]|uniref:Uncharacterized protein n=3 Tax=Phytophthora nicotianae TaxID=4792 RepID=V9EQE1_PHYNI|nr:hypothetical protein F443_13636 [Phytophthora nicotianae P1569]ETL34608.1 hypothetical protein L916_13193 [Phytophthora nicotianae]ETL87874.1 hypothetical protein L917_13012 [Phytophthora nicotianae]ETM41102.1 hypothetical protein L914_13102 [Phytophthora nicotianae]ETP10878.1 hypothetical protein F441_13570 [Phytophthora nicotianae CJ01A1]
MRRSGLCSKYLSVALYWTLTCILSSPIERRSRPETLFTH